eukprot:Selendium_serpulae@DN3812_c3_g1_i1.p1
MAAPLDLFVEAPRAPIANWPTPGDGHPTDAATLPGAASVAAALVAHYSGAVIHGLVKVHAISARSKEELALPQLPVLVTPKDRVTEAAEICHFLAKQSAAGEALATSAPYTQGEVEQWLSFVTVRDFKINDQDSLNTVNKHLALRTFMASVHVTLADLAMFAATLQWMTVASKKEHQLYCNITRWFNHIQHLNGVRGALTGVPVVPLDTDAPAEAKGKDKKGKGQPAAPQSAGQSAAPPAAAAEGGATEGQSADDVAAAREKRKAEKAAKQAAKGGKGKTDQPVTAPKASTERPVEDVTRLNIVVGVVTKIWKHPDSDKLFCEEIDIGEEKPRPIGSGLAQHMTTDALLNQKVLVLANLKQKPLAGYPSHGMVLCSEANDKIEFLRPHPDSKIGERVSIEGLSGEADAELTAKKNRDAFMAVKNDLRTSASGVAMYKDRPFMTSKGQVTVPSTFNGQIS